MKPTKTNINKHRAFWAKIARANGWYTKPFFVQVFLDESGNIRDSVSFKGMTGDIIY